MLEDFLRDAGGDVLGPVSDLSAAFDTLNRMQPDAVTLDLDLQGKSSIPIADLLLERGIPYVIASAKSPRNLPPRHAHVNYLIKPFDGEALVNALLWELSSRYKNSALPSKFYSILCNYFRNLM